MIYATNEYCLDLMKRFQGKGSNIQRLTLLQHTISEGIPFAKMFTGAQAAMDQELNRRQDQLQKSLDQVFDAVLKDFDRMFVVEETPDLKRDFLREQVTIFVKEAKLKLDGPIAMHFATAVKDSDRR